MTVKYPQSKFITIDTTQYAGNFERQMCAYITGQYGDCGMGAEIAVEAAKTIRNIGWWKKFIKAEASENGCLRPVSIWPTPGWFNNGLGSHYPDTEDQRVVGKADGVEYLRKIYVTAPSEKNRLALERYENAPLKKYPAFLSVAIFVREFPPLEVLKEFIERAEYAANNFNDLTGRKYEIEGDRIEITGYRKMTPTYTVIEETM